MTTLREAAQQALQAMDKATRFMSDSDYRKLNEAIDALKEALVEDAMQKFTDVNQEIEAALAEPVQEPVAKVELMTTGGNAGLATRIVEIDDHLRERLRPGQLLYTAPQRKPLSHGEFLDIWQKAYEPGHRDFVIAERVARAIERAHGIKE